MCHAMALISQGACLHACAFVGQASELLAAPPALGASPAAPCALLRTAPPAARRARPSPRPHPPNPQVGAQYKCAELGKNDWAAIPQGPPWAVDAWGLGCLMQEVFSQQDMASVENLRWVPGGCGV